MNQTRLGSLFEATINVLIGFFVALASQLLVFPLFGIDIGMTANLQIGAWFTAISFARSYLIRRYFNRHLQTAARRMAGKLSA